jgi:hypothetical protein
MKYSTPELVVLGSASVLVMGGLPGQGDNGCSMTSKSPVGIPLGLDNDISVTSFPPAGISLGLDD